MKKLRVLLYFILVIVFFFFNFYFRPIEGNYLIDENYKNSESFVNNIYKSQEYFKEKLLTTDDYPMYYTFLQETLKNHPKVSIPCSSECSRFSMVIDAIELDHPELISFQSIGYWKYHQNTIEYRNDSNLNRVFTFFGTKRIERVIDLIKKDTKDLSDKEKILYVYNYVASHDYDYAFTWSADNQSAYSFFTKGTSVCAGFAKTSQLIFQNIGINSYLVFNNEHMWNYVEYEGKYYIFDATVGASFHDKTKATYYDGLCRTTIDERTGKYEEYYPRIEDTCLKDIFGL